MRPVGRSQDSHRIFALPRRPEDTAAPGELESLLKTPTGMQNLRPVQAQALFEIAQTGGLFGPIRVGAGKTLISLLAPFVLQAKRPILLLPAALLEKTQRERRELAKHWRIPQNIRPMSYEMLGRVQSANTLDLYKPDLLVCDEVHKLKNKRAGVTRRVLRYLRENPETKIVAMSGTIMRNSLRDFGHILGWTHKKDSPLPLEEHTLMEWADAVDEKVNPLARLDPGILLELPGPDGEDELSTARKRVHARIAETAGVVSTQGEDVACSLYIRSAEHHVNARTEENFQTLRTRWETPDGWAITEAVEVWRVARQLALGMHYVWWNGDGFNSWLAQIPKNGSNRLSTIEQKILRDCERVTGSGIDVAKALARLNAKEMGYFNEGTGSIPNNTKNSSTNKGACAPHARGEALLGLNASQLTTVILQDGLEAYFASCAIERSEIWEILLKAFPQLSIILEGAVKAARPPDTWLEARRTWAAFAREILSGSKTLDTELQVVNAVDAGELDGKEYLAQWRKMKPTFTINAKPVWHDDSALDFCTKWFKHGGLVWCDHTFFAEELSKRTGVPFFGAKGLDKQGRYVEDHKGSAILSSAANATGKNLQAWSRNLLTAVPASGSDLEQLIGRTHRPGQLADAVEVDILMTCYEHRDSWSKALATASMAQDLLGQRQKVLFADSDIDETKRTGYRWNRC